MVSETLNKIVAAEKKAAEEQESAKEKAKQIIFQAEEKAKEILTVYRKEAETEISVVMQNKEKEIGNISAESDKISFGQVSEIKSKVKSSKNDLADVVISMILSKC